jgi:hypothetical protein
MQPCALAHADTCAQVIVQYWLAGSGANGLVTSIVDKCNLHRPEGNLRAARESASGARKHREEFIDNRQMTESL